MRILLAILFAIILFPASVHFVDASSDYDSLFDGAVQTKNINIEKSRIIENEGSWRGYCNGFIIHEKIAANQNPEIIIDREFLDVKSSFWVFVFPSGTNYSCLNIFLTGMTDNPNYVRHNLETTNTHRTITFEIPHEITSEEYFFHEIVVLGDIFGQSTNSQNIDLTNPELVKTWKVGITPMPKHWEDDFEGVLEETFEYWKCRIPGINFEITGKTIGNDFSIQWQTKTIDGLLGYYRDAHMQSEPYVAITLGQMKDGKMVLTDKEYVKQLLAHEIGHALGFGHNTDDEIMQPRLYNYEMWKNSSEDLDLLKCGDLPQDNGYSIPEWVKNNAEWWSQGKIWDLDFVSGIQYLIKEEIMQIPETEQNFPVEKTEEIPSWIKNNAEWWAQGLISDDDFIKGIQYLVEKRIIVV